MNCRASWKLTQRRHHREVYTKFRQSNHPMSLLPESLAKSKPWVSRRPHHTRTKWGWKCPSRIMPKPTECLLSMLVLWDLVEFFSSFSNHHYKIVFSLSFNRWPDSSNTYVDNLQATTTSEGTPNAVTRPWWTSSHVFSEIKSMSFTGRHPPTRLGRTEKSSFQSQMSVREKGPEPQVRLIKHRRPPGTKIRWASSSTTLMFSKGKRSST
jgi:hypothetical protein